MAYAARPSAATDTAWVQPGHEPVPIGRVMCSQSWLGGLSEDDLSAFGLVRAEVAGPAPVPGLGHPPVLEDVDGVPTWVWSEEGVATLRAFRIGQVKEVARNLILAVMNKDEQDNALALGQEMIYLHGPDPATWPEERQTEYAAIMAKWSKIKAIRTASDAIEAALPNDAEALIGFNVADAPGWPA